MKDTFAVAIGGAAGQGVAIPGNIFAKIFARRGLHLSLTTPINPSFVVGTRF
jgi:2-oxoglutarate ferredoxin oxidoreductase subunit alpha